MTINEDNKIIINVVKRDGKKVNFDASKIAMTITNNTVLSAAKNREP